jgi:hypothetical protein
MFHKTLPLEKIFLQINISKLFQKAYKNRTFQENTVQNVQNRTKISKYYKKRLL